MLSSVSNRRVDTACRARLRFLPAKWGTGVDSPAPGFDLSKLKMRKGGIKCSRILTVLKARTLSPNFLLSASRSARHNFRTSPAPRLERRAVSTILLSAPLAARTDAVRSLMLASAASACRQYPAISPSASRNVANSTRLSALARALWSSVKFRLSASRAVAKRRRLVSDIAPPDTVESDGSHPGFAVHIYFIAKRTTQAQYVFVLSTNSPNGLPQFSPSRSAFSRSAVRPGRRARA